MGYSRVSSVMKNGLGVAAILAVCTASIPATAGIKALHGPDVVRVTVSFNMQVPLSDASEASLVSAQKERRKLIYRMAEKECAVLKESIAETCRLTNVNVSTQVRRQGHDPALSLYLNGSAQFAISLKN
ncbi:MAG: hypothetical protein ACR2PO_16395 [Methyloligellaceae bacterium]